MKDRVITGFSKLSKLEKLDLLVESCLENSTHKKELIKSFWHKNPDDQKIIDEFSENTLTNFYFPYGVIPNVKINDKLLMVPMVTEESSVVAAAGKSAKFWLERGGFKAEVVSTEKLGHVHFVWEGDHPELLVEFFNSIEEDLLDSIKPLLKNMEERGGGLRSLKLIDLRHKLQDYYKIEASFETCDAMGANFINTVLESIAAKFEFLYEERIGGGNLQIIMSILSNYTPKCLVRAWVECPIDALNEPGLDMEPSVFAMKMKRAIQIAEVDVHRATTHNKGIMNGIDSIILASGNDFRAVEACVHAYASRSGQYKSLTSCTVTKDHFKMEIELPLALGTVGGLTALHPMAKTTLDILDNPNSKELMEVAAVIGLAQNFSAIKSLTTSGIQKGHMKMHLMNILNHLEASEEEREKSKCHFKDKTISFKTVREFLAGLRSYQ